MLRTLAESLVEVNAFSDQTVFLAEVVSKDLSGIKNILVKDYFQMDSIEHRNGQLYFVCTRKGTNRTYYITAESVREIDGMDPERYAQVFNIKPDGSKKKIKIDPITGMPKKRGRKTNKERELIKQALGENAFS